MKQLVTLAEILLHGVNPFSTILRLRPTNFSLYKEWKRRLLDALPAGALPADLTGYSLLIDVGISAQFDLDNTLKSILDALEAKYGFNDAQIGHLIARKHVVRRDLGEQPYIKIRLLEGLEPQPGPDTQHWTATPPDDLNDLSPRASRPPRER